MATEEARRRRVRAFDAMFTYRVAPPLQGILSGWMRVDDAESIDILEKDDV
jgi:hypothetical protein